MNNTNDFAQDHDARMTRTLFRLAMVEQMIKSREFGFRIPNGTVLEMIQGTGEVVMARTKRDKLFVEEEVVEVIDCPCGVFKVIIQDSLVNRFIIAHVDQIRPL